MPRLLRSSNDWDKSGDAPDRLDRRYFRRFGRALPDRPQACRDSRQVRRGSASAVGAGLSQPCLDHRVAAGLDGERRGDLRPLHRAHRSADAAGPAVGGGRFVSPGRPVAAEAEGAAGGRSSRCSAASISTRCAGSIRTRRWRAWSPFPASGHGRRKSTCCLPPAIPTFFPRATSPCRPRWAMPSAMEARPGEKALIAIAESWRPWRGVASRLFWAYYRNIRGRDAVPRPEHPKKPKESR